MTHEVIRDYWNEVQALDNSDIQSSSVRLCSPGTDNIPVTPGPVEEPITIDEDPELVSSTFTLPAVNIDRMTSETSSKSFDLTHSAAANLLGRVRGAQTSPRSTIEDMSPKTQPAIGPLAQIPADMDDMAFVSAISPNLSSSPNDGIFLPGSAYLEWHATLRSHMFDITRSVEEECALLPANHGANDDRAAEYSGPISTYSNASTPPTAEVPGSWLPTPRAAELEPQDEYELLKNWIDEVAPWVCIIHFNAHKNFSLIGLSWISSTTIAIFNARYHYSPKTIRICAFPFLPSLRVKENARREHWTRQKACHYIRRPFICSYPNFQREA